MREERNQLIKTNNERTQMLILAGRDIESYYNYKCNYFVYLKSSVETWRI